MDEILRDFVTETSENIDLVDAELVRFEQEPTNGAILAQIFRLVHTVKGTCGFLGLPRLEALAHAAETVIGQLRDGSPVTRETVSLILQTIDRIKAIVSAIEERAGEPLGDDSDLITKLEVAAQSAGHSAPRKPAAEVASGSLVYQVLERPLKPDEVSLDELERAFRETPGPAGLVPPTGPVTPVPGTVSGIDLKRNTIRVSVDTLEHMMTMVSELVLTRNQLMEVSRRANLPEYALPLQRLSQVTGELQDGVMKTRMQPIGHAWATLPRLVRDLCADLGKEIDLEAKGAGTEIDRQLLELIKDPITHIIRNAADHGIEKPEERVAAGKPRRGNIRLTAVQEGGSIKLEIADDGRGLNLPRIRQRAVELGIVSEADIDRMSDGQIAKLVFHAGFSTARRVTNVSGRGVGMDVVQSNIDKAGGNVEVRTEPGRGTALVIRIPLTLAIAAALIVTSGDQIFAIPQLSVVEIVRPRPGTDTRIEFLNEAPVLRLRESLLPVASLAGLLWPGRDEPGRSIEDRLIVICSFENQLYGLAVDSVLKTEEIVVKPVSVRLRSIPVYSGTTILGDGSVIMILDPNGIGAKIGNLSEIDTRHASTGNRSAADVPETSTSLLLFKAGGNNPMAVPLGLVTRLEEIDVASIERAGGQCLLQYRGRLMPLVPAHPGVTLREAGSQSILVFTRGSRSAGLMVDEIIDIVEDRLEIERLSAAAGCIGSAIVRGRATDILDVAALLPFVAEGLTGMTVRNDQPSVLLVDDNDFFRALLSPVLKAAGFKVHVAASAEEALRMLAATPCVALVTDLDMPRISGFDLATRLRGDPQHQALRIVGLSERGGAATVARGHELGFDDIVGKFDRQGLVATLLDLTAAEAQAA